MGEGGGCGQAGGATTASATASQLAAATGASNLGPVQHLKFALNAASITTVAALFHQLSVNSRVRHVKKILFVTFLWGEKTSQDKIFLKLIFFLQTELYFGWNPFFLKVKNKRTLLQLYISFRPPPLLSFCLGVVRHGQAFLRF